MSHFEMCEHGFPMGTCPAIGCDGERPRSDNVPRVVWSGAMAYAPEKQVRIVCGKEAPHHDGLTLHVEVSHVDCMEKHSWQKIDIEKYPVPQALACALLDVLKARPSEIRTPPTRIEKGDTETSVWAMIQPHLPDPYQFFVPFPFRLTVAWLPGSDEHNGIVRYILELPYEDALRTSVWMRHQWLGSWPDAVDHDANTVLGSALICALNLEPNWATWNVDEFEKGLPKLTADSGVGPEGGGWREACDTK